MYIQYTRSEFVVPLKRLGEVWEPDAEPESEFRMQAQDWRKDWPLGSAAPLRPPREVRAGEESHRISQPPFVRCQYRKR